MLTNIDYAGYTEGVSRLQNRFLNSLLDFETLGRLLDHETINAENYAALEMLQELRKGIWSETTGSSNVDVFRRNLQRAYVERMGYLMTGDLNPKRSNQYFNVAQSDVRALVRGELNQLKSQVASAAAGSVNTVTKYHYKDVLKRVELILDPK
jgi:hypothetical protein